MSTAKSFNKTLDTVLSCYTAEGGFEVHKMHQDYYKVVERAKPARITASAVEVQHERLKAYHEEFVRAAIAHYSKEVEHV
jgi:sulfur relay (sulfurtransferase) DsrF/TusC family protein